MPWLERRLDGAREEPPHEDRVGLRRGRPVLLGSGSALDLEPKRLDVLVDVPRVQVLEDRPRGRVREDAVEDVGAEDEAQLAARLEEEAGAVRTRRGEEVQETRKHEAHRSGRRDQTVLCCRRDEGEARGNARRRLWSGRERSGCAAGREGRGGAGIGCRTHAVEVVNGPVRLRVLGPPLELENGALEAVIEDAAGGTVRGGVQVGDAAERALAPGGILRTDGGSSIKERSYDFV